MSQQPLTMIPVYSREEWDAVVAALARLRLGGDRDGGDLSASIHEALASPRLPSIYGRLLARLLAEPEGDFLPMSRLAADLGVEPVRARNLLGKISARMKGVAARHPGTRTPLEVLLDIDPERGSVGHRLTPAGRKAVAGMGRP